VRKNFTGSTSTPPCPGQNSSWQECGTTGLHPLGIKGRGPPENMPLRSSVYHAECGCSTWNVRRYRRVQNFFGPLDAPFDSRGVIAGPVKSFVSPFLSPCKLKIWSMCHTVWLCVGFQKLGAWSTIPWSDSSGERSQKSRSHWL